MPKTATKKQPTNSRALRSLEKLRPRVETAENKASELRDERNSLIFIAITQDGATEREAAEAAGVSPAFAHRLRRADQGS